MRDADLIAPCGALRGQAPGFESRAWPQITERRSGPAQRRARAAAIFTAHSRRLILAVILVGLSARSESAIPEPCGSGESAIQEPCCRGQSARSRSPVVSSRVRVCPVVSSGVAVGVGGLGHIQTILWFDSEMCLVEMGVPGHTICQTIIWFGQTMLWFGQNMLWFGQNMLWFGHKTKTIQ